MDACWNLGSNVLDLRSEKTRKSAVLFAALLLLFLLPGLAPAGMASHSGDDPLWKVTGADACDVGLEPRVEGGYQAHDAIVIIGDEGPTGFILGHDPQTGEPIHRDGVTQGTGTRDDPYIIEGWLIEQTTNGIRIQDTSAHAVIRENRMAHHASHAVYLENTQNITVERNVLETNVGAGVLVGGPSPGVSIRDNSLWNNQQGVLLDETQGVLVTKNAILENRGEGVRVIDSMDARLEGNVIQDPAAQGVFATGSPGLQVSCNQIVRSGDDALSLTASPDSRVYGNHVEGSPGVGVYVTEGSDGTLLEGNHVTGHGYAIMISKSHGSIVHDNHASWSTGSVASANVFVFESHDVEVTQNELTVAQSGIVVRRSHDNLVEGNTFTDHTWGVFCTGNIAGSSPDSPVGARGNRLIDNDFDGHSRSLSFRECDDTLVDGNRMSGHEFDGAHDFESVNNTYKGNKIDSGSRAGIYLWREGGHRVTGNEIRGSTSGVRMSDSSDNRVDGNVLEENTWGVLMRRSSHDNQIEGNHVVANTNVGIYLLGGSQAQVTRNNVIHNQNGIVVGSSLTGSLLQDNDIRDNQDHGLLVQRDDPLPATGNWWGCPEGPDEPACDVVVGPAQTDPWRTGPMEGVSRAPVVLALEPSIGFIGQKIEQEVEAMHPDRDPFTLHAEDLPENAAFDASTGTFEWTPSTEDEGPHGVAFIADDGNESSRESWELFVFPEGPYLLPLPDVSVVARETVSIQVEGGHSEGDPVQLNAQDLPAGAHFADHGDGTGLFTWTPQLEQTGLHEPVFTATSGQSSMSHKMQVHVEGPDDPPEILGARDQTGVIEAPLFMELEAHDPLGGPVTLQLSSEPALGDGAVFTTQAEGALTTGRLDWTPTEEDIGSYAVTVVAQAAGGTTSRTFTLDILAHPPEIALRRTGDIAGPVSPGDALELTGVVENTGDHPVELVFTHNAGDDWSVETPNKTALAPGEQTGLTISVRVGSIDNQARFVLMANVLGHRDASKQIGWVLEAPLFLDIQMTDTTTGSAITGEITLRYANGEGVEGMTVTGSRTNGWDTLGSLSSPLGGTTDPEGAFTFSFPVTDTPAQLPGTHVIHAEVWTDEAYHRGHTSYQVEVLS